MHIGQVENTHDVAATRTKALKGVDRRCRRYCRQGVWQKRLTCVQGSWLLRFEGGSPPDLVLVLDALWIVD